MRVTLAHLRTVPGYGRKPGFCTGKTREFFARHGLDWYEFRHNGLPAEAFESTGDALALALVDWAKTCEAKEHE